jgi:hypothetical protein
MSIEPVGLLTFVIGLLCLRFGYRFAVQAFIVAALFGSAAAMLIGSANIPPAHLLLGFAAFLTLSQRSKLAAAIGAMRYPKPAFWLMCLLAYGVIGGILLPRVLAGTTSIIPLGTSEYADTGSTVPLGPVSSNFTQSVYLTADFVCFVMIVAIAATQDGFGTVANALLAYAVGNVLFALIDLATYNTGTQWLLEFIRNAQYTLHVDEEVSGLKRIVGSFTEASAFAHSTLGSLAFTGTLWLCGYRKALTGALALTSLALAILSTSSTGLAGTPPVLLILYATAMTRRGVNPRARLSSILLLCAPLLAIAVLLAAQMDTESAEPFRRYIDDLIFNKASSDSGIERNSWNNFALQNFFDSYGLGVGLGTVRTSSFILALLSNVGVLGTIFYAFFAISAFWRLGATSRSFYSDARLAARNACLGFLIADTFAGTTVEQGLLFYVFAGLACARPERQAAVLSPAIRQPAVTMT